MSRSFSTFPGKEIKDPQRPIFPVHLAEPRKRDEQYLTAFVNKHLTQARDNARNKDGLPPIRLREETRVDDAIELERPSA
jgi:hypothetical protein